jgi:hypothetical protein
MIAAFLLASVMQVAAASPAPQPAPSIHILVLPVDGSRPYETRQPVTDEELAGASAIYAWTDELPMRRFLPVEFRQHRHDLAAELARQPWREQTLAIASCERSPDCEVLLRYAPVEWWSRLPEHLLPSVRVKAGRSLIIRTRDEVLRIRAVSAGVGTGWHDLKVSSTPFTLRLEPAVDVRLMISSPHGDLAEPSATLFVEKREAAGEVLAQIAGDGAGRIALASVPRLEPLTILIGASGYAPTRVSAPALDLVDRRILLAPAAIVSGRILNSQRKPIHGARVTLEAWLAEDVGGLSRTVVVTDEGGRFEAKDILVRQTTMIIEKKGFATVRASVQPE